MYHPYVEKKYDDERKMKIRFVFKRRRTTRRTTTAVQCGTVMYGAFCVTQGQGYLLRESNTQTCAHPLCTMQHNNARLTFCDTFW